MLTSAVRDGIVRLLRPPPVSGGDVAADAPEPTAHVLHRAACTLGELRRAVLCADLREVARLAGPLGAACGGCGAQRLAGLLETMEQQARAGEADALPALLPELERELARVRTAWREPAATP